MVPTSLIKLLLITVLFISASLNGFEGGKLSFSGKIIPRNSITFYAPSRSISVKGWRDNWGGVKPLWLVNERTFVKKGDLLVEFEVDLGPMFSWLKEQIAKAEIEKTISVLKVKDEIKDYEIELNKKQIQRERLELDLTKQKMMAERDFKLLQSELNILKFTIETMEQKLGLYKFKLEDDIAYHTMDIAQWTDSLLYVENFQKKFKIYSPAAGYITFPMLHRRMKASVGQFMRMGWAYMKLANGKELDVEFYLPEAKFDKIKKDEIVNAEITSKEIKFRAKVKSINEFPIMLGNIEDDFSTPYATEKVFIVKAEAVDEIEFLPGEEVKVYPGQKR